MKGETAVSGYRVQPFEGDPWDEELLRVTEAVDASAPPSRLEVL